MDVDATTLRTRLEQGQAGALDAVHALASAALSAPTRHARLDACRLLGDLAGRALGAEWDAAEQAALALLEAARVADTAADPIGAIAAKGCGDGNIRPLPVMRPRLCASDYEVASTGR